MKARCMTAERLLCTGPFFIRAGEFPCPCPHFQFRDMWGTAMEISREEEEIREIREGVVCAGGAA